MSYLNENGVVQALAPKTGATPPEAETTDVVSPDALTPDELEDAAAECLERDATPHGHPDVTPATCPSGEYNFAYLDEQTKRMIRRALLKAVAVPGYQTPFAGREMPMPYGWGTGGIQISAAILGPEDVLKVIDQGADDTTNAVSIRAFFQRTAGVATTQSTAAANVIQTRHRIPEQPLTEDQIMVYQVPIPEPLRWMEPREAETRTMHGLEEYGVMHVKLYEDIARHGRITTNFMYPVLVNGRYVMSPSPIPKFDNPKLHQSPALHLFGAGREKRIYAVPPYTDVKSLDFEDHPFAVETWDECCGLCGAKDSYLDEIILNDAGERMFVCSDTDYCTRRCQAGHTGPQAARADWDSPSQGPDRGSDRNSDQGRNQEAAAPATTDAPPRD